MVRTVCLRLHVNPSNAKLCKGSLPIKSTQGLDGRRRTVEKYGCIVMEVQDYIDAINQPEWQREKRQIFGPNDPAYTLEADYVFSTEG